MSERKIASPIRPAIYATVAFLFFAALSVYFSRPDSSFSRSIGFPANPRGPLGFVGLHGAYSDAKPPVRVLAAVTGGWAQKQYRSDLNLFYADRVLRNYARACEDGYDVEVVFVSYYGFENWTDYFQPVGEYMCHRTGRAINVRFEFFEWRPIPAHTHGIGGDLITRHREIFAREKNSHDVFISQEDDVSVGPDQIDYFVRWSETFKGTEFYPGFLNMEIFDGVKYVDWRVKNADVFQFGNYALATTGHMHTDGRMYMLTRGDLVEFSSDEKFWTGSVNSTRGEFQPNFATPRWLQPFRKIVHPLVDFERSLIHHMSNKYIKMPVEKSLFEPLTVEEQRRVFYRCISGSDECSECFRDKGAARMDVEKKSRGSSVDVKFSCIDFVSVKFSGYKGPFKSSRW